MPSEAVRLRFTLCFRRLVLLPHNAPVYDAAGNTLADGSRTYSYDAWNRLTAVHERQADGSQGKLIASYRYDGNGYRIAKAVARYDDSENPSVITGYDRTDYYYNTSWQVVEERYAANVAPANVEAPATAIRFQYVPDITYIDTPLVRYGDTDGDGTFEQAVYYLSDANHNVTALVNAATGDVVERYSYSPYGTTTIHSGQADMLGVSTTDWAPLTAGASTVGNVITYTSYRRDGETGLFQVRRRYYDADLGRWINRDPAGYIDGMNLYGYVGGRPVNAGDPTGLSILTLDPSYQPPPTPQYSRDIDSDPRPTDFWRSPNYQGSDFRYQYANAGASPINAWYLDAPNETPARWFTLSGGYDPTYSPRVQLETEAALQQRRIGIAALEDELYGHWPVPRETSFLDGCWLAEDFALSFDYAGQAARLRGLPGQEKEVARLSSLAVRNFLSAAVDTALIVDMFLGPAGLLGDVGVASRAFESAAGVGSRVAVVEGRLLGVLGSESGLLLRSEIGAGNEIVLSSSALARTGGLARVAGSEIVASNASSGTWRFASEFARGDLAYIRQATVLPGSMLTLERGPLTAGEWSQLALESQEYSVHLGNGTVTLVSGTQNDVPVLIGREMSWAGHTHPGGSLLPSWNDISAAIDQQAASGQSVFAIYPRGRRPVFYDVEGNAWRTRAAKPAIQTNGFGSWERTGR